MADQQSVFEVPTGIMSKVEEIFASSRSRFGHGAFYMNDDGGDDGGDGDDGGGQTGGLLDDEAENGGDDGGDDDGQGGNGGAGSGGQSGQQGEYVTQAEFESTLDRRINQAVNTIVNRLGGDRGGQQQGDQQDKGGGSGGQSQSRSGQQGTQSGPAAGDVREARLAYREYVTGEIKFLGNEERTHAMGLAQAMLVERLSQGDDPETAGREVAKNVGAQMKALRSHYEGKVVAALQRTGQLPKDGRGNGQPLRGGTAPGAQSGFIKGQETAQRLLGNRMPAETK